MQINSCQSEEEKELIIKSDSAAVLNLFKLGLTSVYKKYNFQYFTMQILENVSLMSRNE